MPVTALLLLTALANATPPAALAPGSKELRDSLDATRDRVDKAEVYGVAVIRIQRLLAERVAADQVVACDDTAVLPYLARSPAFLAAWRDATQSARVELERLEHLESQKTMSALLDTGFRQAADDLARRVSTQVPACEEALAWQARYVTPILTRCAPVLDTGPGIATSTPWVPERPARPVAVVGVGGGFLCPGQIPANGVPVVFADGQACYGVEDCSCFPAPVLPGAVLGPLPPAPAEAPAPDASTAEVQGEAPAP